MAATRDRSRSATGSGSTTSRARRTASPSRALRLRRRCSPSQPSAPPSRRLVSQPQDVALVGARRLRLGAEVERRAPLAAVVYDRLDPPVVGDEVGHLL